MNKRPALLPYEKSVFKILSLYRFFAFAIAVVILQVIPLGTPDPAPAKIYTLLSIVGAYSFVKIFFPFHFQKRGFAAYFLLASDMALCILIVLLNDGLDSGFLLYSLIPVITASLLFEQRIALSIATLLCLSLTFAHLVGSQFNDSFVWILDSDYSIYLVLFIIYVIVCFLIATLAYRTNLNVYRRIEKEAILEERSRIGREIHDSIAQALAYLKLKTTLTRDSLSSGETSKALVGLRDMQKVSEDAYQDVREIIDSLSTEVEEVHLIPTLAEYIRVFRKRTGIRAEFHSSDNSMRLSPLAELQMLRIAQESLTNIRKHAQASQAWVRIGDTPRGWEMVVEDNGKGFPSVHEGEDTHHGLKIMMERAHSIGAVLSVETNPDQGTKIVVRLPR